MVAGVRPLGDEPQPLDPCRGNSPTVLRIVLGTQLRRLREAHGITREAAGDAIRASHAKISRLELGRVGFKERDITDLLDLYGVTDRAERAAFLRLVRQANTPGWWHQYCDVLPGWFEMLRPARAGRVDDPQLPGAVRAGPVPDRGVRPRRHHLGRPRRGAGRRDRAPRAACG